LRRLSIQTAAVGGFMCAQVGELGRWSVVVETGVQTLCYGLGIIFMLGGVVTAYLKALQVRIGRHE
jgi:hypothetical protein